MKGLYQKASRPLFKGNRRRIWSHDYSRFLCVHGSEDHFKKDALLEKTGFTLMKVGSMNTFAVNTTKLSEEKKYTERCLAIAIREKIL
ncbi:MAG: hypothetical protein AAGF04_03875 [Chlamydiota bacterium]